MRTAKILAIPLIGILLVLGACSSGGTTSNTSTNPPAGGTPVTPPPPNGGVPAGTPVTPVTPPAGSGAPVTPVTPVTPPAGSGAPVTPPAGGGAPVTPPPATGPASFVISNLHNLPDIPEPGQGGTLFYTVTNAGGTAGTYNIVILTNGQPTDLTAPDWGNKVFKYDLSPGQSQDVAVNFIEPEGTYTFTVKSDAGDQTITVKWIER